MLVPLGAEPARELLPVVRQSEGRDRVGAGRGVCVKVHPVSDENGGRGHQLNPEFAPDQKINEAIAHTDLGEHVRENEIRLPASVRREKDGQGHKESGAIRGVHTDVEKRVALGSPAHVRERHGHAHHEHEARLDQIPESAAGPLDMAELIRERLPRPTVREFARHGGKAQPTGNHRQHDETTISIERNEPLRLLDVKGVGHVFNPSPLTVYGILRRAIGRRRRARSILGGRGLHDVACEQYPARAPNARWTRMPHP